MKKLFVDTLKYFIYLSFIVLILPFVIKNELEGNLIFYLLGIFFFSISISLRNKYSKKEAK